MCHYQLTRELKVKIVHLMVETQLDPFLLNVMAEAYTTAVDEIFKVVTTVVCTVFIVLNFL